MVPKDNEIYIYKAKKPVNPESRVTTSHECEIKDGKKGRYSFLLTNKLKEKMSLNMSGKFWLR